MGYVIRVSQLIGDAHRVEEPNRLVCTRANQELDLLEVADVNDWSVMCIETLEDGYVPGRICLE